MAIRVALYHETSYCYDRVITLGPQTSACGLRRMLCTPIPAYSLRIRSGRSTFSIGSRIRRPTIWPSPFSPSP